MHKLAFSYENFMEMPCVKTTAILNAKNKHAFAYVRHRIQIDFNKRNVTCVTCDVLDKLHIELCSTYKVMFRDESSHKACVP